MLRARSTTISTVALIAIAAAVPVAAQTPASAPPQAAPAPAPAPLSVTGLLFGSYNFTPSTTPNPLPNQTDNGFILDRAYINFRAPAGEHMSVRVTTDIYQTSEATANAYTIRAKYAYLQYDGTRSPSGAQLMGRIGILQNVLIEHQETFWPRYLSQVAVERAGYFSSADAGVAAGAAMPDKLGEVYATIVNGSGYATRENNRFKDYAIRLSFTPLASHTDAGLLQTFTISPWIYKGALASKFVNIDPTGAQVGAIGEALDRTRLGLFAGIRDPRLVLAAEYAQRKDGIEFGANTVASPRVAGTVTGHLLSAFTVFRPFAFANGTGKSPFAIIGRYDQVKPTASSDNVAAPAPTDNAYHTIIGGVSYDVNPRVTFAADYQESLASNNGTSNAPPAQSKGYFAHFSVGF